MFFSFVSEIMDAALISTVLYLTAFSASMMCNVQFSQLIVDFLFYFLR